MKISFILILILPLLAWGQSDNPPTLYEAVVISVKAGHEGSFEETIKAHNAKFHADGAHRADVFQNINGPNGGTYSWVMGPTKWAALDNRPAGDAHDSDWGKVMEHVTGIGSPSYWMADIMHSQVTQNSANTKQVVWTYDLVQGKEAQWAELIGKVKKVYAAKRPNEDLLVGWNVHANAEGTDALMIFTMDEWGDLDDQRNFAAEYEEVHGVNTWTNFLNHVNECVKQRVDWMRQRVD